MLLYSAPVHAEYCDQQELLKGFSSSCTIRHSLLLLLLQGVALIAPWEESSPLLKFISENFSHQAADMVLEGQELLVTLIK